jgi:sugar (pentulose or hexulose) kinase
MVHQYLLGIDTGTTKVKALLYDLEGREITSFSVENEVYADGAFSEQDMNKLWDNVLTCLTNLIKSTNIDPNHIMGIGVTGQGEGIWALDANYEPVRNSILWNDGRALDLVNLIKKDDSLYKEIKKVVASYIKPGSTLTLIKWLKEYCPEIYKKTEVIFTCKDWIRYKLTNNIYWELSDATCSCVDLEKNEYAISIFEKLGIKDAIKKLPKLIGATDNAGYLQKEVAENIGLREGIPVSGGMLDIISTAAGLGAVQENDVCIILGTTGMTFAVHSEYVSDYEFNGWETHIDRHFYVKGMGTMAATPNLDWAIKMLFRDQNKTESYEKITSRLENRRPFESGLIYHPHISNAGERAPFFNPKATAQLLGIQANTTRYDIVHAIMEGVALSIKDCLKSMDDINKIYLSGGGAKNPVWVQIISDVLNADIYIADASELAAKGAALSAGIMTGLIKNLNNIEDHFSKIKKVVKPRDAQTMIYQELFAMYKQTQMQMNEFWDWRFEKLNKF